MSFLSEVLGSIGTGQVPAPSSISSKPAAGKPAMTTASVANIGTGQKVKVNYSGQNGLKRKTEDDVRQVSVKTTRTALVPASSVKAVAPTSASNGSNTKAANGVRPVNTLTATNGRPRQSNAVTASLPAPGIRSEPGPGSKPPARGSFADIMNRARLAQEKNGPNQVGVIKHLATSKERVSRIAMQKNRAGSLPTTKLQRKDSRTGTPLRRRSVSPQKGDDKPKSIKPPAPPLHRPTTTYKGTMGLPSKRLPSSRRQGSRQDEYLGTDEEDDGEESEMADSGIDESDGSSDMEAGAFDIEREERAALRAAKVDDAKELALEMKLKREKEERRKSAIEERRNKLQTLANKAR